MKNDPITITAMYGVQKVMDFIIRFIAFEINFFPRQC